MVLYESAEYREALNALSEHNIRDVRILAGMRQFANQRGWAVVALDGAIATATTPFLHLHEIRGTAASISMQAPGSTAWSRKENEQHPEIKGDDRIFLEFV